MTGNQVAWYNVRVQEAANLVKAYQEGLKIKQAERDLELRQWELEHKKWYDQMRLDLDRRKHEESLALEQRIADLRYSLDWYIAENNRRNQETINKINWFTAQSQHEDRAKQRIIKEDQLSLDTWKAERQYGAYGTEWIKAAGTAAKGVSSGASAGVSMLRLIFSGGN